MNEETRQYLREIGSRGGKAKRDNMTDDEKALERLRLQQISKKPRKRKPLDKNIS